MLYGSECWAINKADMGLQRIDAVDQWCLRRILDIRWHDIVRNADIRRITYQPQISSIIKSCRLIFFGHLARMDKNADAIAKLSSNLRRRVRGDSWGAAAHNRWRTLMMTYCLHWILAGPILSVFPALIVHSELKSVHPGFPVAFIFLSTS